MTDAPLFKCPNCGADLNWSPGQGNLCCPYCSHVHVDTSGAPPAPAIIQEYDLATGIRLAPKGWGTEKRSMECSSCGAVSDVDPQIEVTACPFCGSTQLLAHGGDQDVIRPESLLPFVVEKSQAMAQFRKWLGGLWFRPTALKTMAQLEKIAGIYIPAWTFDCGTWSSWSADAGYYYYVEESYQEKDQNGHMVTKTRKVQHTRWQHASGNHQESFDDWTVQASGGLDQGALKGLEPFDYKALAPYENRFLAGFQAERYKVDLASAWAVGQKEMGDVLRAACSKKVPGDTQRNLQVSTSWQDVKFKHLLIPIWVAAYRYNNKPYRYLVNGQTGKATGDAPISWYKVIGFILALVFALGAIMTCAGLVSGK